MRKMFLLLSVLGVSCAAFAQTDRAAWTNLSGLHPGQRIRVTGFLSSPGFVQR
jgi:hypothetical protein